VTRGSHRFAVLVTGLLAGLLVVPAPSHAEDAPMRILLEGDSITQGFDGDFTWRYRFYNELKRQGVRFDLVGSRHSPIVKPGYRTSQYADPHFDSDHFAQVGSTLGWHARQINAEVRSQHPDVIVLEAGVNDLRAGASAATTESSLRAWIANARAGDPDLRIIVSAVLDATDVTRPWLPARIRDFRQREARVVSDLSTPTSPITLADTNRGWSVTADTSDNLHPTPTGETLIAQHIAEEFHRRGYLPQAPHIYRPTPWGRIARVQARAVGRRVVLTWDNQALTGVKVQKRRLGRHWTTTRLKKGGSMVTRLHPGRYQFRIKMIRARISTAYGPTTGVVVRRRSHRH
jgi:hypothetical protein